jgi:hypothetical protein
MRNPAASASTALRYRPTLVREFCGAMQITAASSTPSARICRTTSGMYGRQFRIPTYTETASPPAASSSPVSRACTTVISVSGLRPISE